MDLIKDYKPTMLTGHSLGCGIAISAAHVSGARLSSRPDLDLISTAARTRGIALPCRARLQHHYAHHHSRRASARAPHAITPSRYRTPPGSCEHGLPPR